MNFDVNTNDAVLLKSSTFTSHVCELIIRYHLRTAKANSLTPSKMSFVVNVRRGLSKFMVQ